MSTRPLPIGAADNDNDGFTGDAQGTSKDRGWNAGVESGRALRFVETLAGALSAGLVMLGLGLLGAQLIAPGVVSDATGPGWTAVALHLLVGAAGEAVRWLRGRWPVPVRWGAALVVIAAVLLVLTLHWWR